MNDREFGNKIKQDLNYGTGRVEARVMERLKLARERALDAFAARAVTEDAYAFAGMHGQAPHHSISTRKWLSLAMLLLALVVAFYWQQQMSPQQEDDVDAALLASDLPFNAFIDQNFHSWLDHSSQQ